MLRKMMLICVCLMVFAAGCGPEKVDSGLKEPAAPEKVVATKKPVAIKAVPQKADVQLQFAVGDTASYNVITEWRIDFKFEQPTLKKLDLQHTGTKIEMEYLQEIERVADNGDAVAKITIENIVYYSSEKKTVNFDFDSTREGDMSKPFAELIGKSYKIKISPDGSVEPVNTSEVRGLVTKGYDSHAAKSLFRLESLKKMHEIVALPDAGSSTLNAGQSWKRAEKSDARLRWAPKNLEKTYTLAEAKGQIIKVEMNGVEKIGADGDMSAAEGLPNIFEPEESYTGQLVLKDGKVDSFSEKFVGSYVAAELPSAANQEVGPDVLTMGFTRAISVEKLN